MNRSRLRRLITVLKNVKKSDTKFAMGVFYEQYLCGAAACALGHAAIDPNFNRAGLKLGKFEPAWDSFYNRAKRAPVRFKGSQDFQAGERFFGLNRVQSEFLFDPNNYTNRSHKVDYEEIVHGGIWYIDRVQNVKPQRVIKRIEYLLSL